jgi:FkbM family methyltransferase
MFFFEEVTTPPRMSVVDIGAMFIEGDGDRFERLSRAGLANIIGFEPLEEECRKLNAAAVPGRRYLPYAVANGKRRKLHVTNTGFTSSLLEPDLELASRFNGLAEYMQVVSTPTVDTVKLDDVAELRELGCDLLKLDTQGAEVEILTHAKKVLKNCLIVQCEVEFIPLYKNQPLFADVDQLLRAHGFMFHRFLGLAGRTYKPLMMNNDKHAMMSQVMWSDALYVPDLRRLGLMKPEALVKLAALLHEIYGSFDLCHVVLAAHDEQTGSAYAARYVELLRRQQEIQSSNPGKS